LLTKMVHAPGIMSPALTMAKPERASGEQGRVAGRWGHAAQAPVYNNLPPVVPPDPRVGARQQACPAGVAGGARPAEPDRGG
jgi:hypothetical protein